MVCVGPWRVRPPERHDGAGEQHDSARTGGREKSLERAEHPLDERRGTGHLSTRRIPAGATLRATRTGRPFLGAGLVVGVAAGIGLLVGFEPARLPPALLNIAVYKLTFVAAVGLLAAGATLLRYGRREEVRDAMASSREAGSSSHEL